MLKKFYWGGKNTGKAEANKQQQLHQHLQPGKGRASADTEVKKLLVQLHSSATLIFVTRLTNTTQQPHWQRDTDWPIRALFLSFEFPSLHPSVFHNSPFSCMFISFIKSSCFIVILCYSFPRCWISQQVYIRVSSPADFHFFSYFCC